MKATYEIEATLAANLRIADGRLIATSTDGDTMDAIADNGTISVTLTEADGDLFWATICIQHADGGVTAYMSEGYYSVRSGVLKWRWLEGQGRRRDARRNEM